MRANPTNEVRIMFRSLVFAFCCFVGFTLSAHCEPPGRNLTPSWKQFDTSGHPKAKGLEMWVSYPSTWTASEGLHPNIVQKFSSPSGLESTMISCGSLPTLDGVDLSAEDASELFTEDFMRELTPEKAIFHGSIQTKIEGLPAGISEYTVVTERAGLKVKSRTRQLVFIFGKTIVFYAGSVVGHAAESEAIDTRMDEFRPLFTQMAIRVVLPKKWQPGEGDDSTTPRQRSTIGSLSSNYESSQSKSRDFAFQNTPTTGRPENLDMNLALTSFGVGDLEWLIPLKYFLTKYPHALFGSERSDTKTYIVTGTFCGRQVTVDYAFDTGDETLVLVLVTFSGDSGEQDFEATEQILSRQIGELKRSPAPGFAIQSESQHYATTVTHNLINATAGATVEQLIFRKQVGKLPTYETTNIPPLDLEISERGWGNYSWGISTADFRKLHPRAEFKAKQSLPTWEVNMMAAGRCTPVLFTFFNDQLILISIPLPARINDAIFDKHRKLLDEKFGPFTKVPTPPVPNVTDQYDCDFGSTRVTHMRFLHDLGVGEAISLSDRSIY